MKTLRHGDIFTLGNDEYMVVNPPEETITHIVQARMIITPKGRLDPFLRHYSLELLSKALEERENVTST